MGVGKDYKLITCILAKGLSAATLEGLRADMGIDSVNIARGRGGSGRSGSFEVEMDILEVVVPADRADSVFEYLYDRLEVADKPQRFMFQMALARATHFELPADLPAEEAQVAKPGATSA